MARAMNKDRTLKNWADWLLASGTARPDTRISGQRIHSVRVEIGRLESGHHPVPAGPGAVRLVPRTDAGELGPEHRGLSGAEHLEELLVVFIPDLLIP